VEGRKRKGNVTLVRNIHAFVQEMATSGTE
jgi:hypothetical protein